MNKSPAMFLINVAEATHKHIIVQARNEREAETLALKLHQSGILDMDRNISTYTEANACGRLDIGSYQPAYPVYTEADLTE